MDIICFQEHKLRGARLAAISDLMWPGAEFFPLEAAVAYNNAHNANGAGSGGTCMWVSPRLYHLISESGQSRDGHAQWIKFHGVPGQDVGVLNVYAPHCPAQRCALWHDLMATRSPWRVSIASTPSPVLRTLHAVRTIVSLGIVGM